MGLGVGGSWFRSSGGRKVNPRSALAGGGVAFGIWFREYEVGGGVCVRRAGLARSWD